MGKKLGKKEGQYGYGCVGEHKQSYCNAGPLKVIQYDGKEIFSGRDFPEVEEYSPFSVKNEGKKQLYKGKKGEGKYCRHLS